MRPGKIRIIREYIAGNRKISIFRPAAAILCLFLFAFFGGRALRGLPSAVGNIVSNSFSGYESRTALFIWKNWYPSAGFTGINSGGASKEVDEMAGRLAGFILKQVPYYRLAEGRQGKLHRELEPDPSYGNYLESSRILKEYECLVRDLEGSSVLASGGVSTYTNTSEDENGPGAAGMYPGNAAGSGTGEGQGESVQTAGGQSAAGGQLQAAGSPAGDSLINKGTVSSSGIRYVSAQLADYDFLMKHFYTVHPTTTAGRDMMSAKTFLSEDFSLKQGSDKPQILIYHTHSQEEFADYHEGNKDATIVGVGTYLTELLEQKGYNVIHDTSVYDLRDGKLDRSKAYTYALDGITAILQKNPSIQVVLDIHRDGVKESTHLVKEINGKKTATIMFFNGTSQTPDGAIEYLKNPYRTDNMAFSFQMKLCADACYPGFTRKIYLKGLRYNQHVRPCTALIEVGAQNNTYEEARNAMEPLAELLDMVVRPEG